MKIIQSQRKGSSIQLEKLNYYGEMKRNEGHFQRALDNILIERVPGSEGSRKVREVFLLRFNPYPTPGSQHLI